MEARRPGTVGFSARRNRSTSFNKNRNLQNHGSKLGLAFYPAPPKIKRCHTASCTKSQTCAKEEITSKAPLYRGVAINGSTDYNTFLWKAASAFGCLDHHIRHCEKLFEGNKDVQFLEDLCDARNGLFHLVYSPKPSGLKFQWHSHDSIPDREKDNLFKCLSKMPWASVAKASDVESKRSRIKLDAIEKDCMYQYNNLDSKKAKADYIQHLIKNDPEFSFGTLSPSNIINKIGLTDRQRFDLVIDLFNSLTRHSKDAFYSFLWSQCCQKAFKNDKTVSDGSKHSDANEEAGNLSERVQVNVMMRDNQSHGRMPWECEEWQSLELEEEDVFTNLKLELLEPLLQKEQKLCVDMNIVRRAIVFKVMKSINHGEGGVWETALLQNVELRKQLQAAMKRIAYLEQERESVYRNVDIKIEKEAVARDSLIRKAKERLETAERESQGSKMHASKLNMRVMKLEDELLDAQTSLKSIIEEHEETNRKLIYLERLQKEKNLKLKALEHEVKKPPQIWEILKKMNEEDER